MLHDAFKLLACHYLTENTEKSMVTVFLNVASLVESRSWPLSSVLVTSYLWLEQSWDDCKFHLCTLFKEEAERVTNITACAVHASA